MISPFAGARALITGGCGFIGSNLARRLVGLGAQVTIVDSLVPEYGGNSFNIADVRDSLTLNVADVRDPHSMRYLIQGHDFLFNLAGQTSHLDSMTDPQTDLDINCRAQLSILEACRHNNTKVRIVFAGTRQVYGKPDYLPVDERHPIRPVDVNGINKMAGEWFHLLYSSVYGIGASVLRLTNTYGPRMRVKDSRQTFVGVWIRALVEGKPFEVWGGEQLRDFTYVDDAVEALLLAATDERARGKVYNLGGKEVISLKALGDALIAANGSGKYVIREFPEERKKIDIGDYYSDFTMIKNELGWEPKVDLTSGLAKTLAFYRAQLAQYL
ncbi:MAG: NAD-dependent epimerase/dehydratase [bacterium]|jgi:UDP-glucose 4-epimerase|nr:NAD-dependent epimerase/dehydratase [bacterium]